MARLHYSQPDVRQVYGFELQGKQVGDAFQESSNSYVIEFTDGTRIRIRAEANEVSVQKLISRNGSR